ncbi:hypothetical protein PGT21_028628 [Puccinia graminis f. sp. tritici]|uniref:Uncharacterized protein n=1 Tax=Puccinia graminis f. sp. tritici TaxID=56615 RepID=A0A5B0M6G4_PUCGR|nr:hypothetical protein PGT21_028628 [Puccinia graminis f. sp. tritici]KAA1135242.1 hypothetical protein PGTUg99_021411 [Puccinia graminis f. sp. tritici]
MTLLHRYSSMSLLHVLFFFIAAKLGQGALSELKPVKSEIDHQSFLTLDSVPLELSLSSTHADRIQLHGTLCPISTVGVVGVPNHSESIVTGIPVWQGSKSEIPSNMKEFQDINFLGMNKKRPLSDQSETTLDLNLDFGNHEWLQLYTGKASDCDHSSKKIVNKDSILSLKRNEVPLGIKRQKLSSSNEHLEGGLFGTSPTLLNEGCSLKLNHQTNSQKKETVSRLSDKEILPKNLETWKSPTTGQQKLSLNNQRTSQENISSDSDLLPHKYTVQENLSQPDTSISGSQMTKTLPTSEELHSNQFLPEDKGKMFSTKENPFLKTASQSKAIGSSISPKIDSPGGDLRLSQRNILSDKRRKLKSHLNSKKSSKRKEKISEQIQSDQERKQINKPMENQMAAWIFGMSTYDSDPEDQRFKTNHQSKIDEFSQRVAGIMNKKNPHQTSKLITTDAQRNILQFSEILWFVNLRFLRSIGYLKSGEYIQEHFLLQEWIINILENEYDSNSTIGTSRKIMINTKSLQALIVNMINYVLNTVHKSDEVVFNLGKRENESDSLFGVVSQGQLSITKIAIQMLVIFYRITNDIKWHLLFPTTQSFNHHLAKIQEPYLMGCVNRFSEANERIFALKLLPWNMPCGNFQVQKTLLEEQKFYKECDLNLNYYVKETSNFGNSNGWIDTQHIVSLTDESGMRKEERMWKRFSKITGSSKGFDLNLFNLKHQKLKINQNFKMSTSDMYQNVRMAHLIERFLTRILELNSRLLELFGHWEKDSNFLDEQLNIQKAFFDLLESLPTQSSLISGSEQQEIKYPSQDQKETITRGFIFESIAASQQIFKESYGLNQFTSSPTKILLSKTAVRMLSYYYQSRNFGKWLTVFKNEKNFFTIFKNIGKRAHQIMLNNSEEMKLTGLLPWKGPLNTTKSQREIMRLLYEKA